MIGDLIGLGGSLIGGLIKKGSEEKAQNRAIEEARRAEKVAFEREDTKLQRVVKDAAAAGLHPLAAIGSQAVGTLASPVSPEFKATGGGMGDVISEGARGLGSLLTERHQLENELLRAQIRNTNASALDAVATARSRSFIQRAREAGQGGRGSVADVPVTRTAGSFGITSDPRDTPAEKWEEQYGEIGDVMGAYMFFKDAYNKVGELLGRPDTALGRMRQAASGRRFPRGPRNSRPWSEL